MVRAIAGSLINPGIRKKVLRTVWGRLAASHFKARLDDGRLTDDPVRSNCSEVKERCFDWRVFLSTVLRRKPDWLLLCDLTGSSSAVVSSELQQNVQGTQ